ncbi:pseudouridine synthase [Sphaerotilus mobilis]|uniref:tRNA pseudouridine32 synthase/23S rRNA pseudouridine746 synthase n=1 Tax=Sphaerotilus mobilis TaxID=47994 RepID=A0A4Q7LHA2_9BURK|nr:pseudouridine synthase [Sphaerotilus mobilis]RZS53423.1 tRNA pseudouridine32 synthase/23S rRNA pseudouridine746 synthase [Sphaerotilus mobilis]
MSRPRPAWTPPDRDGIGASRVALAPGPWATLIDFLPRRLPALDVAGWLARIARGEVLAADGRAVSPHEPCAAHRILWYWRTLDAPEPVVPFEADLLHVDEHLVVADKPHFLPMTPKGRHLHETLLTRLKRQLGIATLAPMHRLDRETAGVVVFTVRPDERDAYQRLLRERAVHKVYEAIAPWRADLALPRLHESRLEEREGDAFMQMHEVPGEPNAQTRIELIGRLPSTAMADAHGHPEGHAHYRLHPLTGRKHQLRAHLSALGMPIVGDRIYPVLQPMETTPDFTRPLQLLAREVAFDDPVTGTHRRFLSRRGLGG